jgi:DNA-binding MarR family transcriptional regulator
VLELMRRDLGIPYSTLAAIIRRLERKGALRLGRVKPLP